MPFSDLSVTRNNIDAFEGNTLSRHSSSTTLGLTENDDDMASKAVKEVRVDIFDRASKHYYQGDYSTKNELLDALESADGDGLIEDLMAIKFLEFFFNDEHIGETDGGDKAVFYEGKYNQQLPKVVTTLLADLTPAKNQNVVRFTR